jgi:CubicO group peptidase (beta-lactamase class C family)
MQREVDPSLNEVDSDLEMSIGKSAPARSGSGSARASRLRRAAVASAVGLVLLAGSVMIGAAATTGQFYWSRILIWQDADFGDSAKFPSRAVAHDPRWLLPLVPAARAGDSWPSSVGPGNETLEHLLARTGTAAFIVARGQDMLYEHYFNGYSAESTMTSFSVAKAFVSALVGRAIADGHIESVADPITKYLPELSGRNLDRVTIAHLLEMSSGLRYDGAGSGGSPFQDDARTYYDPHLRDLALTVQADGSPGETWQYNNYHPLLLGLVLERTTGQSVSEYLSSELWGPVGMEAPGSWSLDSVSDGFEKMESGINGRARDFTRFGMLYAAGGSVDGRAVLPESWIAESTSPKVRHDYGYFWWIDGDAIAARGNLGQIIYVLPSRRTVVARFGEQTAGVNWLSLAREVAHSVPATESRSRAT